MLLLSVNYQSSPRPLKTSFWGGSVEGVTSSTDSGAPKSGEPISRAERKCNLKAKASGAIYSFFNRISITGVKVDEDRCVNCNICIEECKMDVMKVSDHECIHCGECIKKCPVSAISYRSLKNRGETGGTDPDRGDRP